MLWIRRGIGMIYQPFQNGDRLAIATNAQTVDDADFPSGSAAGKVFAQQGVDFLAGDPLQGIAGDICRFCRCQQGLQGRQGLMRTDETQLLTEEVLYAQAYLGRQLLT